MTGKKINVSAFESAVAEVASIAQAKKTAIQVSEDLKGISDKNSIIENVKTVCDYVIDVLESVVGSDKHLRSQHENETVEHWKEVKKQANKLNN